MAFTQIEPTGINSQATFTFANIAASGVTNLGPIGNIRISGGSSGQVIQTDGAGNLTWSTVSGGGGTATTIAGSNVTGQVGNALLAGTVYTAAQPNITSVGSLTSLTVIGNITSGNANLGNLVTANFHSGSGNMLSNIQGANITGAVSFATTANAVAGANVSGAVAFATTANAVAGANVSGQVSNALIAGTVYTAAQPNITSVGTLTNLDITGNLVVGGNLTVNGTVTSINSTIVQVDDLALVLANDASSSTLANGAGIIINGASANMLYINSTNSFTFSHKISADGSLLSSLSGANVTGAVAFATTANAVAGSNVSGQIGNALVAGTVYTAAQPNITSIGTLTNLTASGNVNLQNWTTLQQSTDVMTSPTFANPLVISLSSGGVVYVTPSSNFTINITNAPTTVNRVIQVNIILSQGTSAYFGNAVQIEGTSQTLRWASGTAPTPGANKIEVQSLSLIRTSAGAWVVLGDYGTYA